MRIGRVLSSSNFALQTVSRRPAVRAAAKGQSAADLDQVLGLKGLAHVRPHGSEMVREIVHYLDTRRIYLPLFRSEIREQVTKGLIQWCLQHRGKPQFLAGFEKDLNKRVIWRPLNDAAISHGLLSEFLDLACEMLSPKRDEMLFGERLKKSKAWKHVQADHALHAQDYRYLIDQICGSSTKRMKLFQPMLRLLPKRLDLATAREMRDLAAEKSEGFPLCGDPGRIVILPLCLNSRVEIGCEDLHFALLYLPRDPALQDHYARHDKLHHRKWVQHHRHGGEYPGYIFGRTIPNFPGSIAYAHLSVRRVQDSKAGTADRRLGIFNFVQSDVTQYARTHAPRRLCREFVGVADYFLEALGADLIFFPTENTVARQAHTEHIPKAEQQRAWRMTLSEIYGQAPAGYIPSPVSYGNYDYYLREPIWKRRLGIKI